MRKKLTNNKLNLIFALLIAALSLGGISARAATITVINTNNSGAGSLRQAISDAVSGDTIDFNLSGCPCAISLTSAELLIDRKNIIINGPGANQLTVSGNSARRVFRIRGINPPFVTISGLTIANGTTTENGGGIYLELGTLTVANSVITGNTAPTGNQTTGFGGGIFAEAGTRLNINNTTVIDNISARSGGGIATTPLANTAVNITIVNSTVADNDAGVGGGGGVFIAPTSTLTSFNSNFTNNNALGNGGSGGGILNQGFAVIQGGTINLNDATGNSANGGGIGNSGTLTLTRVSVSNNMANTNGSGGGISNTGTFTLTDSTVANNQSVTAGGGINTTNTSVLTITNSTISGNNATGDGGGVNNTGTLNMTNSTVSGNQIVSGFGGGINNANNSAANLTNCTIAFNSTNFRGGGVANDSTGATFNVGNTIIAQNTATNRGPDAFGTFVSNGFNLIGSSLNQDPIGFTNGTNGDIVGGSGPAVINPLLNPLANNGGPTQTHELQSASPAIDKGNSSFGIVTDQRGNQRFIDVPQVPTPPGGNSSDIGAFEFSAPTAAASEIKGRVMISGNTGLRNAFVVLYDDRGGMQTVRTGTFGYYNFTEVEVGRTYVLTVRSKTHTFSPQVITVADAITKLDFIAQN